MTAGVKFKTADVLRLEVEDNATGPVNQISNPSGVLGGWGWVTPLVGTVMRRNPDRADAWLDFPVGISHAPMYFYSESAPADPGNRAGVGFKLVSAFYGVTASVEWLGSTGAVLATTTPTALTNGGVFTAPAYVPGSVLTGAAPAGTTDARLRFDVFNRTTGATPPTPGDFVGLKDVVLLLGNPATFGSSGFVPDVVYVNVLGSSHDIGIERSSLDVGTLTATILDSALDPAKATSILKPGRRLRAMVRIPATGFDELDYGEGEYGGDELDWTPIFTGRISKPAVVYDLLQKDESKRSRITVTALDPMTTLTRNPRAEGVATIDELPYVLEGCGVPWSVNGSGNQVSTATVVAVNDQASAVDQVAVTRDTALGFAWVDRFGVLQVWDADQLDSAPSAAGGVTTLDEHDYRDIDLDYDTDVCINSVQVDVLRMNAATGETETITYGPYQDAASIRANEIHTATYTVQGLVDDEPTIAAYAQSILDANSTPRVRCNSVTVPIARRRFLPKALVDLYDPIVVSNARADDYAETLRVVGVSHQIDTSSWLATFSFTGADRVAAAQVVPQPSLSGNGTTLREQLRPLGEVTMWWGAVADVPPGWLVCDGSAFDATTYPALVTHLGGTTLPNMTDRFPIGAGTKALGTSGGSSTVTLSTANLPAHGHGINRSTGVGTSGNRVARGDSSAESDGTTQDTGSGSPVNVLNPWRAFYFIIRAV